MFHTLACIVVVVGCELLFLVKGLIYRQLLSGPFIIAAPLGWGGMPFCGVRFFLQRVRAWLMEVWCCLQIRVPVILVHRRIDLGPRLKKPRGGMSPPSPKPAIHVRAVDTVAKHGSPAAGFVRQESRLTVMYLITMNENTIIVTA